MNDSQVHYSHCIGSCKYGEDDCPAVESLFSYRNLYDRLDESLEDVHAHLDDIRGDVNMIRRGKHYMTADQLKSAADTLLSNLQSQVDLVRTAIYGEDDD